MPPLEGDKEKVKEGKGLKVLAPNKLLTKLSILLAQIKAGNSSDALKNEIKEILYLLHERNKITKFKHVIIIMEENKIVIRC